MSGLRAFENVESACAIDQIDQSPIIEANVIALHALCPRRNVRHEGGDLTRRVRVGDIDDAKTVREPSYRNLGAADLLTELMEPGVIRFLRPVLLGDLETGEGDRARFVGDVHDPQK